MMRYPFHLLLAFGLVCALGQKTLAQGGYPIAIQVQLVPPYSAYIEDYLDRSIISFTNQGQVPLDIYIRGRFENDRGQFIETAPDAYSLVPINVPAMQTAVVHGSQLDEGYLNVNRLNTNLADSDYDNFKRTGILPEGLYTFCITAYIRNQAGIYVQVSVPEGPGSCFPFHIAYATPPVIIAPFPHEEVPANPLQQVAISWTTPLGNLAGALLAYDVYLVKVPAGYDANVAMAQAVQYGAGLFHKEQHVQINNFLFSQFTGFPLEEGAIYALMVQAKDLQGRAAIQNGGRSEVQVFTYGTTTATTAGSGTTAPVASPFTPGSCTCSTDIASLDKTNHNAAVTPGSQFTMAGITVTVASLSAQGATLGGEGTITMGVAPVQVSFSGVVVNAGGVAVEGSVAAKSIMGNSYLGPDGSPAINTANFASFLDRLSSNNLGAPGAGLLLPFGLQTPGAPDAVNVAVTGLSITPAQAAYDAMAVVQLADANNVLSLMARNICFSQASLMCGDAIFSLGQDLALPVVQLTLRAFRSNTDPGTYVRYVDGSMQRFRIQAEYEFPTALVTRTDGSPLKAMLDADAASWSDWTAQVSMDPFKVPALAGVTFNLAGNALYDHSTLRNPAGMPTTLGPALAAKDAEIADNTWQGFFLPAATVAMPALVSNTGRPDNKLQFGVTNLVLDGNGLTGQVGARDVVEIGKGSLGGWYCSVDQIGINLLNSSFIGGGMGGQLVLPFSDRNSTRARIDYSCTLSAQAQGGELKYQFVAQQRDNLDFSAWWATININNCSIEVTNNTADGSTRASASLNGAISLQKTIQGHKLDFELLNIQGLQLSTQQPYVQLAGLSSRFSSPQHSFSGFPVSIERVEPKMTGSKAGVQFQLGVNISDLANGILPTARTSFTISADVLGGTRPLWKRTDLQVDEVCLEGDLGGLVTIKRACLRFFRDHAVFGDGVEGNLEASFAGFDGMTVACNAKFGNTRFNYWYFDASVGFAPPIALAPGISLNGFGGGAWYNLARTANNDVSAKDYFKRMNQYQLGAYRPQEGTLGFKAKVGVSSNDGYLFSGYGEIGLQFDMSRPLSFPPITGTVYAEMLKAGAGLADDANAPVQGVINWYIGLADGVYQINGRMEMKYPPVSPLVQGQGWFDLLADGRNGNYHVKFGVPDNRIELTIADLMTFRSYFMAGNNIGGIPEPDPLIVDVSKLKGYEKLHYDHASGGMVMGASFHMQEKLEWAIFYLGVELGLGFDISLARYEKGCDGRKGLPGLNGWYGLGQVYAKLAGSIGVDVDLPMVPRGVVVAGEIGASVLLQGGLPNPYWFNGYVNIYYNALGLLKGNVDFKVSIGDKCVPETQMFTLPLVQELKPANGSRNIPLNASPGVLFNYPAETVFEIVVIDVDGRQTARSFRMDLTQCLVTDTDRNKVYASFRNSQGYAVFVDNENKDLALDPVSALEPQTNYRFEVAVNVMERKATRWEQCTYDGKPVQETHSTQFRTGECKLDELISDSRSRLGAFPFPGQRYFLPGESGEGAIILDKAYACASAPSEKYELLVRFTPIKNGQALPATEKPIRLNGSRYLKFDLPQLPNDHLVRTEVIKRKQFSASESAALVQHNSVAALGINRAISGSVQNQPIRLPALAGMQGFAAPVQTHTAVNIGSNTATGASLAAGALPGNQKLRLTDRTVDVVLYSYHFRTSRYNTLQEKMNAMHYGSITGYSGFESPTVQLNAVEPFDQYDAKGFVSQPYLGGAKVYFSVPLITLKDQGNSWMDNYARPCVYDMFLAGGLSADQERYRSGISYQEMRNEGILCTNCLPKRPITINTYRAPLSTSEIEAEGMPAQFPGAMHSFGTPYSITR